MWQTKADKIRKIKKNVCKLSLHLLYLQFSLMMTRLSTQKLWIQTQVLASKQWTLCDFSDFATIEQSSTDWCWLVVGVDFPSSSCEPSCCESCRLDSIVCGCGLTGAMVLSPLFIHVHFQLKVIRIIHWSEFSVNVWVSREVKTKIRKKTFELQVKQKLLNNEMTNSGTSAS